MKVFNLSCRLDHRFEGWFASAQDFEQQCADGRIACPICGDVEIRKLLSAPRLNLSASQTPVSDERPGALDPEQLQALWLRMARQIRENTVDVGERFAEEARRIHYDRRAQQRQAGTPGIRGVATPDEAAELADEGIEVFSFPMPVGGEGPLQ